MTRYSFAWALGCFALLSSPLGCGDDGGKDGSGGAGATGGTAGVTSGGGGSGSGGEGGSSPGGSPAGGSPTGGGGSPSGGSPTGGSGGASDAITQLMNRAKEACELLEMTVVVKFADESIGARLTGRVVDGSLMVAGADEVLKQETILGHLVELHWADGTEDGAQVPVRGWVKQNRDPDTDSRYRCFDGEVQVRVNDRGNVFYIFAGNSLSEATADGTCGAPTTKEEVHGCLPAEY